MRKGIIELSREEGMEKALQDLAKIDIQEFIENFLLYPDGVEFLLPQEYQVEGVPYIFQLGLKAVKIHHSPDNEGQA